MRLWSLHPKYLDTKGLVALWRESLLAKHVLEGRTTGYTNHPQLIRFRESSLPLDAISQYLSAVHTEACKRHYHFDKQKVNWDFKPGVLIVTTGQLGYESKHLLSKLKVRDLEKYNFLSNDAPLAVHPLFTLVEGEIEHWERL